MVNKKDIVLENIKINSDKLNDIEKEVILEKEKISLLNCKGVKFDIKKYNKVKRTVYWYDKLDFNTDNLENYIDKFKQDISILIETKNEKLLEQNNVLNELENLNKLNSGICPVCQNKIDKKNLNNKISLCNEKLDEIRENIANLDNEKKKKEENIKFSEKKIKKIKSIKEKHQNSLNILNSLNIQKLEYDRWKDNEIKINQIKSSIDEKNSTLFSLIDMDKKYNKMLKYIDNEIEKSEILKKEILKLDEDIKLQQVLLEEKTRKHEEINQIIISNEDMIKNNKSEIEREKKNLTVYKGLLDYVDFIKKICKDENVKQYAISNTVPFLTKQVNKYLSEAAYDFYLKLDGWLNVEVKGAGIKDAGFGNLSSGQQKTTNLAMILSFLDICKLQKSTFPDILLLDEILDGAIDSVTLSQMFNIIAKKQKEDNLKLFIVSHRKEINELSNIDNIYQVEMKDGFSHIRRLSK